jgi:cytochrome c biogenesis protein ResB
MALQNGTVSYTSVLNNYCTFTCLAGIIMLFHLKHLQLDALFGSWFLTNFFFFLVIGTGFSVLLQHLPVVFSSRDKNVPRENNNLFIEK